MLSRFKNNVLANQLALVFLVFVLSQFVLAVVLWTCHGVYFDPVNWIRWDSAFYLEIAEKRYEYFPCAGKFGLPLNYKEMCGNTAWFPGYSMLLRFLALFFKDLGVTGAIVSKIFYALILFFVARIAEMQRLSVRNFLLLSIAAFNFGFIYYNAVFPISGLVFSGLASYYFFQKDRVWLSGFFCFCSSYFYTTGFLVTVALCLYILLKQSDGFKTSIRRAAVVTLMGLLGFAAVFVTIQLEAGDWRAFMMVQSKYGNGTIHNPLASIGDYIGKGLHEFSLDNFKYYQTALVVCMYSLLSTFFFIKQFYKNHLYTWAFIYVTCFFFFPWVMGGNVSFYRSEALLLPFVFLLKDAKTFPLALVFSAMLVLGFFMSRLFFVFVLV